MSHMSVTSSRKLTIGPANYAGQAFHWTEAVRAYLRVPAESFTLSETLLRRHGTGQYRFAVHHTLPHHRASTTLGKRLRLNRLLSNTSHVALDGFAPVYSRVDRGDLRIDIRRLQRAGYLVALIAHGSDVRDPDHHMMRYASSYYADSPAAWVETLRAKSRFNREVVGQLDLPVLVSTPDLLLDVPTATWLPLAVDVDRWQCSRPAFEQDVLTILHAPSRTNPPIKGSRIVEPVLQYLSKLGAIRYLSAAGVSHEGMPGLIGQADIIVDQIQSGSYGVAAVEGMAAGRLVVGYVADDVRALMPEPPPIVDAPKESFEAKIHEILCDIGTFASIASRGPDFVKRWHNGRASAIALRPFLDRPAPRELAEVSMPSFV